MSKKSKKSEMSGGRMGGRDRRGKRTYTTTIQEGRSGVEKFRTRKEI